MHISPPATDASRRDAAAALRALNDAFVAHDADPLVLREIHDFARTMTAELARGGRRDRAGMLAAHVERIFGGETTRGRAPEVADPMSDRAVGGVCNPLSTEFDFEFQDREVVVRTTLGAAYEGAPGRAHGGMVAALFDDVTGFVLPLLGTPAYTGKLTVRYHRPVPVGTPLELRSRLDRRDGRKVVVTADCRAGDELVASAEALFITVDNHSFGQLPRAADSESQH